MRKVLPYYYYKTYKTGTDVAGVKKRGAGSYEEI